MGLGEWWSRGQRRAEGSKEPKNGEEEEQVGVGNNQNVCPWKEGGKHLFSVRRGERAVLEGV